MTQNSDPAVPPASAEPWRYVLSAGRTGTVFLESLFAVYAKNAVAVHEPDPTRYQMMLGNLRNDWNILATTTQRWVHASRRKRLSDAGGSYIEINPFLCSVTDLLPDPARDLRIVHIVREPASWARSMTVFKASRKFRWIIDYIPFSKPFPSPRPDGWSDLPQFERNLWRWVWCNQRILALKPAARAFVTIRYEDLFSQDVDLRSKTVRKIFEVLDLPAPDQIDWTLFDTRINPAPASEESFDLSAVTRIAGPSAQVVGYDH